MTQPQIAYRLLLRADPYSEPERELGVYATHELAEQVRQFLFENWDPDDICRPAPEDFRIAKLVVEVHMPEFHSWSATIDLATGEEIQANHRGCPSSTPVEPQWDMLSEPRKHVRYPMRFVAGSGKTVEEAFANAWQHYEKAIQLGAKDILQTCKGLAEAALVEAERRERESEPDVEGNPPREAWQSYPDVLEELADLHWGPLPADQS